MNEVKIPMEVKPDELEVAEKILLDAGNAIRRANREHGHTLKSFTMIGEMWSTYITHIFTMRGSNKLEPRDVAHMLSLLKQARAVYGYSEDNFVDGAGYTSLAAMLTPPPAPTMFKEQHTKMPKVLPINELGPNK